MDKDDWQLYVLCIVFWSFFFVFVLFNFVYFHVTFLLLGYIVFVVACMFYLMLFILFDRPQDWCLSYDRNGWICSSKGCIVLQSPVLNKMRLLSTVWFLYVTLSIYVYFFFFCHIRVSDSWQLLHQLFLTCSHANFNSKCKNSAVKINWTVSPFHNKIIVSWLEFWPLCFLDCRINTIWFLRLLSCVNLRPSL